MQFLNYVEAMLAIGLLPWLASAYEKRSNPSLSFSPSLHFSNQVERYQAYFRTILNEESQGWLSSLPPTLLEGEPRGGWTAMKMTHYLLQGRSAEEECCEEGNQRSAQWLQRDRKMEKDNSFVATWLETTCVFAKQNNLFINDYMSCRNAYASYWLHKNIT